MAPADETLAIPAEEVPVIREEQHVDFTIDLVYENTPSQIVEKTVAPVEQVIEMHIETIASAVATTEAALDIIKTPYVEPVAEVTTAAEDSIGAVVATTGNIRLSEFVSSPTIGDEWIELFNADTVTIDVTGWTVRDASGKPTTLSGMLAAGEHLIINKPLGRLNNDIDDIELRNSNGVRIDSVQYGTDALAAPKSGESAVWHDGSWQLTAILTPGAANTAPVTKDITEVPAIASPEAEEVIYEADSSITATADHSITTSPEHSGTASDAITTSTTKSITVIATAKPVASSSTTNKAASSATASTTKKSTGSSSRAGKIPADVTQITTTADDTLVRFTGTVIATPGTFGTQVAYLQGAALYLHSANWPQLAVGDTVEVTGTVSTSRGERRIKLSSAEDLRITGHEAVVATPLTDPESATTASLVTVEGAIIARNGDKLLLRVGNTDVTVSAHENTGITWSGIDSSTVRITGVLKRTPDAIVLMPRSADDIVYLASTTTEETASALTGASLPVEPIVGGGLLVGASGAVGYWYIRSRKLIPSLAS